MPRISVVVPAYDAMPFLPATIGSLLAQTETDFEAIVVDNGSSDGTTRYLAGIEDPRVRVVRLDENAGLSGGYNAGLSAARAPYCAFLEADDLWNSDKLARQAAVLDRESEVGLVYTWVELIDAESRRSGRTIGRPIEGDVRQELLSDVVVPCGSSPMMRRELLLAVGGWDEELRSSPDWDLYLRLADLTRFRVITEPLVGYRQHRSNTSMDWRTTERDLDVFLDRAYSTAPAAVQGLKGVTKARMVLYFSWKALRTGDAGQAAQLRRRAVRLHPPLRRSSEFWRLSAHTMALRLAGPDRYEAGLTGLRAGRALLRRGRTRGRS